MTLSGMWLVLGFAGLQVLAGVLFIAMIGGIVYAIHKEDKEDA